MRRAARNLHKSPPNPAVGAGGSGEVRATSEGPDDPPALTEPRDSWRRLTRPSWVQTRSIMSPTLDELQEKVSASMRRRGVVRAGVFGSVVRGDAGEESDIDFLVELEKGRSLVDLAGLRLDLCDLLGRDVDVATPGSLHPKLRE